MRELHYGPGVLTVSFDVCAAVFDYTVALANVGRAERITVPVHLDGEKGFSNLLLGPTTQLYCTAGAHEEDAEGDAEDAAFVEMLAQKTRMLLRDTPLVASDHSLNESDVDFD